MEYRIEGKPLPVVICQLNAGETMITERGSMSWMSPNMKMETTSNGGLGKALGRMFAGEALFQNRYTAQGGPGTIAFAPMGEGGFGYDPVFFLPKLKKTFAQLTAEEKNAISHRGLALEAFQAKLEGYLKK